MNERVEILKWVCVQLVMTLLQGAVVAFLVRFILASFENDVSYTSVCAICVVAIGALRLQRLSLPRSRRRQRRLNFASLGQAAADAEYATVSSPSARLLGVRANDGLNQGEIVWSPPLPETLEHRFARMYRHVDRITYAVAEIRHYDSGVRPVLAEIARDRLRRFHGVDFTADPARARALMGDDLWNAATESPERIPTIMDIDRWLTELEQLAVKQPPQARR